jgi:hypothetical protein
MLLPSFPILVQFRSEKMNHFTELLWQFDSVRNKLYWFSLFKLLWECCSLFSSNWTMNTPNYVYKFTSKLFVTLLFIGNLKGEGWSFLLIWNTNMRCWLFEWNSFTNAGPIASWNYHLNSLLLLTLQDQHLPPRLMRRWRKCKLKSIRLRTTLHRLISWRNKLHSSLIVNAKP